MSVESRPNKLTKGLVLDTFHTDVDNTVATYALNSQLEDQEGNHFHYGSEVGTTFIKDIPDKHVVIGHINMERNETVLFTTDGTNSTIGILSRNDDMSYHYEIKVDDTKQTKKLGFKKEGYVRGVYRLLNGCDKVIYFVDGINKDRRININQLDSYKLPTTASVASGIIFDDSLRATIFGLSSATGTIQLVRLLSASPEATASVLANLTSGESLTKLLTASANGIGTAFANLMRTANMISSTNATGTSTANVDIIRLLQGNVSAIGSVNAILEVRTLGTVEIDVTLTGVASSTAILLRAALLESNLTTEASTVLNAVLTRVINAQSQATANTSATAQITVPVNATANAMAETTAIAQLSQVINASLNATATSSVEALIGLVLVSTTTASGSVSTADLYINRLLSSSVTATGATTAEMLIAKLLQSSVTASASTTSDALVSKLASSSITASANTTTDLLVSKLLALTVDGLASVTADLKIADLLSTTINGTASVEALLEAANTLIGDPYIDNVSLLLQGDDNPSGVTHNKTFINSSATPLTITPFSNVTQGTFSPFNRAITNSGGSAYFDGSGDFLTVPDNEAFTLGANNFTIEMWVYPNVITTRQYLLYQGNSAGANISISFGIEITATSKIRALVCVGETGFFFVESISNITQSAWSHIAFVRNGTSIVLYINGISVATTTIGTSSVNNSVESVYIGSGNTFLPYNGYISNLRIVKGTAVYTTDFNPSTIPLTAITNTSLLLNFTNAAIFDGVKLNNVETVGGAQINTSIRQYPTGSLQFDGNGDNLTIPSNSVFAFGTGDFTIELFVRFNLVNKEQVIIDFRTNNVGTSLSPVLAINTSGQFYYFFNGAIQITTSAVAANVFHHVALVRSGSNTRIYVNGSQSGITYVNSSSLIQDGVVIGLNRNNLGNSVNFFNLDGYIDDLRITKGIARYTGSTLTVPTSKFPDLKNTVSVDYLVVAGGGGGGGYLGGGGAGGYKEGVVTLNRGTTYTIDIGTPGGAGGSSGAKGTNGLASSISGTGLTQILSTGGGGGGGLTTNSAGNAGGSGGGGGTTGTTTPAAAGAASPSGEGNAGGTGNSDGVSYSNGGGGGGANSVGVAATSTNAGNGGSGKTWTINSQVYAAGGGGGVDNSAKTIGTGGSSIGGNGAKSNVSIATTGSANTGSGGGGGLGTGIYVGKNGGSGVVVIRSVTIAASTTGSPTVTTPTGYYLYTFTGDGSITF